MILLTLLVLAGVLVLSMIGWGVALLLIQLGVIVKEAERPVHIDNNDYRMEQGREVGRAKE